MSRMKSIFAIAVVIAAAGAVQMANAQATIKTMIVGASGSFNAVAVGAYNAGKCPNNVAAGTCGHYSFGTGSLPNEVQLLDTRPTSKTGGVNITDVGASIWVVWDHAVGGSGGCTTTCNVWAYVKVDSVVGNRCFFANPRCQVVIPAIPSPGENRVPAVPGAWPSEAGITVPPNVAAALTSNPRVSVAASEVRPEDAFFANCRVNSQLGGANDNLAGLGYNASNAPGVCPTFGTSGSIGPYVGHDLTSAFSGTTAHPVAFNISGNDPITNAAIPAFSTVDLGGVPVIFITDHEDPANVLANVSNVTIDQLQKVFSGASCKGPDLGGGAGNINVYQREPLSGTMQAAEYTVFRLPRDSAGNYDIVNGASQETGIGSGTDPVSNLPCAGGGGGRYRAVGNGDETAAIQNSFATLGLDGIGYMFFSYANVKALANSPKYRYLAVNGVDPVFQVYNSTYDPAQPGGAGTLPAAATLPAACGAAFPCAETLIWKGKWSFPNVRNGAYRHWIMIRLIGQTGGTAFTNAQALVATAQAGVVTQVPDFVPALETVAGGIDDPGLKLRHSHYTQAGKAPHNRTDGGGAEAGGDVGGCLTINASTATSLVYREKTNCTVGP